MAFLASVAATLLPKLTKLPSKHPQIQTQLRTLTKTLCSAQQQQKQTIHSHAKNQESKKEQDPPRNDENVEYLPPDEWFGTFQNEVLDDAQFGNPMDGLMRNMMRWTAQTRTRGFGALPSLLGKNLLWLQLVLIDENRFIQGKLYGIGANVFPNDANVVANSRKLFREAAPYLLQGISRWVFFRSQVIQGYSGFTNEALKFHEYDPLGGLDELPQNIPSAIRCTEVFLFIAGDYGVKDYNGLHSREAVQKLLHELNSAKGIHKLHGFDVVVGSTKVAEEKLAELKDTCT